VAKLFLLIPTQCIKFFGIPFTGKKVPTISSSSAKAIILKDTSQSKQAAKNDDLIAMVNADCVGDKFARIFLLIALGIFLCPSSNCHASHHYYEALSVVKDIRSFDWCSAVSEFLHLGIVSFHSNLCKGNSSGKETLAGCVFILVLKSADSPRKPLPGGKDANSDGQPGEPVFILKTPDPKHTSSESAQGDPINFESARKVMPLSLRVFCGEVTHPEVESFIKSSLGIIEITGLMY